MNISRHRVPGDIQRLRILVCALSLVHSDCEEGVHQSERSIVVVAKIRERLECKKETLHQPLVAKLYGFMREHVPANKRRNSIYGALGFMIEIYSGALDLAAGHGQPNFNQLFIDLERAVELIGSDPSEAAHS
jgi:hypothetical protein